ncbi:MAG TPA: hypothetical protein VN872_10345 [Candidatus Acidoferrum sp.]|nr:hypothetical protein [Candidatus Acidoferrum sp.]
MAATQHAQKSRFYAGCYWRTRKRTRFWGWGNPSAYAVEQPWAMVADWLRLAHSLADSGNALSQPNIPEPKTLPPTELAVEAASESAVEQKTPPVAQGEKRRLRFVCDRHFVGLVYR